ncbi:hypothetical protein BaRGS_00032021 [Batillaria attramentaria]|uniref:USP domain-containing protein n=1 Tax=Batillaria attramentaria TaxID=370345 RepID=A0ABD0JPW0_9CAEN
MDHILEGVLASSHPETFKRELIQKITEKGQQQHPAGDIRAVLSLATNWVLQGTTELQVSSGFKLFNSWAQHHIPALEAFFTRDLLVNLLTKPSRNQANLPLLLSDALNLLQHLKIVEAKSAAFIQENTDIVCVKNYMEMLLKFKDSLPKGDLAARLAIPLLHTLASNPIPAEEELVFQFIKDVSTLSEYLKQIWSQANGPTVLMDSLKELFQIISAVDGPEPSVCLGSVVRYIPVDVVQTAVRSAVLDPRITDAAVNAALRRMVDWLVWPTCRNIDQWIVCFLKELAAAKKFSILISVTENKVEQVMEKLQFPPVREAAFNILSHMLLSFQHSPEPFHKVLQQVPETLDAMQRERTESAKQWRIQLAKLLHCVMFLHTGFPDLYGPILDLIKDVPSPSTEEIQSRLAESRWSAQQCDGQSSAMSTVLERSDTGKTGLFNLGNTCYMNSILQTLFMCDEFRRQTLARVPYPEEELLDKLQQVFASLHLSQRPAVAPMKFLAASRPPWFTPGQQQDCSEFLKFLLDQIHEQQLVAMKKHPSLANGSLANGSIANGTVSSKKGKESPSRSPSKIANGKVPNGTVPNGTVPNGVSTKESDQSKDSGSSSAEATIVKEAFGGNVRTTIRCLSCKQESHRVEGFIDIPLAFPEAGSNSSSTSPMSPKSLAGGGANVPHPEPMEQETSAADKQKSEDVSTDSKAIHINELMGHYLSTERMEGDNQYRCDRCGKLQDGERTIAIIQSPRYLILTLLRFAYDTKLQTRSKVFKEVSCPRTLALPVQKESIDASNNSTAAKRRKKLLNHLNPRLPPSVSPSPENCELYGLCSIVVHSGASSECGHYYCYARHSQVADIDSVIEGFDKATEGRLKAGKETTVAADNAKGGADVDVDFLQDKWYLFNDARVSHATYSSFSNVSRRFQKDTPYLLVYKKLELDSHEGDTSVEPNLRQELRDTVNKDNTQYLKEQELAAKQRSTRSRSASTSSTTFTHWRDPDSDQGPPGSCGGGGGLGGLDTSGSRFVF